ncbi:MAG: YebC/PmpR family DNA-binding transcriptional regulator [Candidatus Cloacimonetes bacterium]|nr:YebC/PmpR family DNA-binding transcriptional regulator [Candidatus Cloacimonadota bacterium]
MAGHNKWSQIKHRKGAADAKRGKLFTRIAKEIIISAREGGGDINSNSRLRTAVQLARGANMPKDNIEKAIKRGTGEIDGSTYEEITYEGYGHNGVAIIVECTTDNKNRTVADIRHVFSKHGGNLAENGAVSWNFDEKGAIEIKAEGLEEDEFMLQALDLGADDVEKSEDIFIVYTALADFYKIVTAFEENGFTIEKAELTRMPKNTINADDVAEKLLKMLDKLEDLDDVQKVYANFEISDEVMNNLS